MAQPHDPSSGKRPHASLPSLSPAVDVRLEYLSRTEQHAALRAFAVGCATRAVASAPSEREAWMLRVARTADRAPEVAAEVRDMLRGAASGAGAVGLRRGLASAARFLAVYAALRADAHEAACQAALMELRCAFIERSDLQCVHQVQSDRLAYGQVG